jgi:hypothetical protein
MEDHGTDIVADGGQWLLRFPHLKHVALNYICCQEIQRVEACEAGYRPKQVRYISLLWHTSTDLHGMLANSRLRVADHVARDPAVCMLRQGDWKETEGVERRVFVATNFATKH